MILLLVSACAEKSTEYDSSYQRMKLVLIDSVLIDESQSHISPVSQAKFINDSLIAISSHKEPSGVWIYNYEKNKIENSIISKKLFGESIVVSGLIIEEYPKIKILNKIGSSILTIDLGNNELTEKINLEFPADKTAKPIQSIFFEQNGIYYIEQYSSDPSQQYKPDFYQKNSPLGKFDLNGAYLGNSIDFPALLKNLKFPILPYKHITQSVGKTALIGFPASGELYKIINGNWSLYKKLPPKSAFFEFGVSQLEKEYNPLTNPTMFSLPTSNFFDNIFEDEKYLILSTWIKKIENPENVSLKTHILLYDKFSGKWYETDSLVDFLIQGTLIGAKKDTLYFLEGNSVWRDEKYIKRAILKPIED